MTLSDDQLDFVREHFQSLSSKALEDDLLDHCCCGVEELMVEQGMDFKTALMLMRQRLIPNGADEIEDDLEYLETYKPRLFMKKFVFASGYLSTLCLIIGVVLITLSFFKRESADMDRVKNETAAMVMIYETGEPHSPEVQQMQKNVVIEQGQRELETLESAINMFSIGQTLLVLAVCLFSITILPYHFYSRYQRASLDYQHG